MKGGKVGAVIMLFVAVVGSVYLYNRFLAPSGKTIADLGKKAA